MAWVNNEDSFTLDDLRLTLTSRANFFLVEDLTKLSGEEEKSLEETSLSSWFTSEGLNLNSDVCEEESLYFPFPYDKFQKATTSLLGNKASIIQGPPGTGKSETISNIITHLAVKKNKVLFVSQKPQALRVVKDKLKTLNVPLSFGYIPSVKFDQPSDEENDTISSQLSALDTHGAYKGPSVNAIDLTEYTEKISDIYSKKDKIIAIQRQIYATEQEKKKYQYFDQLPFLNTDKILINLTEDLYSNYLQACKVIDDNCKKIDELSTATDYSFDRDLFTDLSISDTLKVLWLDVKETGFDRSSGIGRYFNNLVRQFRLSRYLGKLPKELYDEVNRILGKDVSRHSALKKLEELYEYCVLQEAIIENNNLQSELVEVETNLSISKVELQRLSKFLKSNALSITDFVEQLADRNQLGHKLHTLIDDLAVLKKQVTNKNEFTRKEIVAQYLSSIVSENISRSTSNINVWRKIQELIKAFKKSKKAFKTFDNLKNDPSNFQTMLDLVPVWIMDLDDASRLIPLVSNLFDYVVFDEASQCNIAYTIPSMYRAKKAIFVGDPEQMRDSTVMFKSNQAFDQLASRYKVPENLRIKPSGTAVQSVLDIAKVRFGVPKILQYHYRSSMELIGFSNMYFYAPKGKRLIALNNKYLTYKDTNRIMLIHDVEYTGIGEVSDRTNNAEALKALSLYLEMFKDPRYEGKSFAILTFFNDQAELIRKTFEDNRIKENDMLKIAVIEGIQGDEKDVIIYSFVIRDPSQKRQYLPLTGETGDIRKDINAGRVNVAFSRAKLQVHCLLSMPVEKVPTGIWIKKYLEYVRDNGEVSASKLDLKPFDSYFEEEFYNLTNVALGTEYTIQNQMESCGFKIDFVITNCKTGKQLAVECDGPTHFNDSIDEAYGIYVDSDVERQRVLESAGWTFYRIGYSEWIESDANKIKIINELKSII